MIAASGASFDSGKRNGVLPERYTACPAAERTVGRFQRDDALIGCDAEYVPLARKLSGIGTRTILLAWDFQYEFVDDKKIKQKKEQRTSQALIEACTYPVMMVPLVDDRSKKDDPILKGLFVETS